MPEYIRQTDLSKFDMSRRFPTVPLIDRSMGSEHCRMYLAKVPAGGGGRDLHIHAFDQFYFIISGTMKLQIGTEQHTAGPLSLVVLPAGVPHKNWNEGPEEEMHIALLVPEPEPGTVADVPVT